MGNKLADYFTKPLQGRTFIRMQEKILNLPSSNNTTVHRSVLRNENKNNGKNGNKIKNNESNKTRREQTNNSLNEQMGKEGPKHRVRPILVEVLFGK